MPPFQNGTLKLSMPAIRIHARLPKGHKWWLWPDAGFDRQGHILVQGSQKMLDANFGSF
jgi:hypothetical protein